MHIVYTHSFKNLTVMQVSRKLSIQIQLVKTGNTINKSPPTPEFSPQPSAFHMCKKKLVGCIELDVDSTSI